MMLLSSLFDLQGTNHNQDDVEDYSDAPRFCTVSKFKKAAISYMAGYIAQMVQKKTTCPVYHEAVGSRNHKVNLQQGNRNGNQK